MTKPRDPTSIHGAWFDTGRALTWEVLAKACGVSAKVCMDWADPDRCVNGPPKSKTDIGDQMLRAQGHAAYNHIATGVRIGQVEHTPQAYIAEATRWLELAARSAEGHPEETFDWLKVAGAMIELRKQSGVVDKLSLDNSIRIAADRQRLIEELRARHQEDEDERPFRARQTTLRSVVG